VLAVTSATIASRTGGQASPAASSPSTTATSPICSAVFALETSSGRISIGAAVIHSSTTPPTITRSRNTTSMASQSGSWPTTASVTYMPTISALSANGSRMEPSTLPARRRASHPSTASEMPASANRAKAVP
jgi:hypothetical protein